MMPVVRELRGRPGLLPIVCVTGQHRELLRQVFAAFDEAPDIDLDLMAPGQSPSEVTARVLLRLGEVLARERPELLVVHGDTTTAMAASLAGFHAGVPVAHVEAGLRTNDLRSPWPEEFNRIAIDTIAALLFAPTQSAAANLAREANRHGKVLVTGNTGIDALLQTARRLSSDRALQERIAARYPFLAANRRLVLVTGHRRESFGEGLRRICAGLASLAQRGDVQLVFPVHPQPRVQAAVRRALAGRRNIHLIPPVDYPDIVFLMQRATLLVTDSGGLQEEAPALGKPVLVTREVTERPEALATGLLRLVGSDPARRRREADALLDDPVEYSRIARPAFPYGDGRAARRIVDAVAEFRAA